MYPSTKERNHSYIRPQSMINAISYEKVLLDIHGLRDTTVEVHAAAKIQPAQSFRLYNEPDTTEAPGQNVVCSGTPLMISEGSSTGSARMIGILMQDAQPGDVAMVSIEGLFLMQAATSLGTPDSLRAKTAYYDTSDGLVYDAAGGDSDRLKIGFFEGGISQLKPNSQPISGYNYVSVRLDYSTMQTNTAVALPADAALTNVVTPFASAEISAFSGLDQNLTIRGASPNPNYLAGDLSLTVSVEGTEVYSGVFKSVVAATFTAGAAKTVAVTITDPQGNSATANYTVTMSASAAPSAWASV